MKPKQNKNRLWWFGKKEKENKPRTIKRSKFIELMFTATGKEPFGFTGREYLYPLYDTNFPQLVLVSSRQGEKSTYISNDALCDVVTQPNDRVMIVSGFKEQAADLTRNKIDRQFRWNPRLFDPLLGRGSINNEHEKLFTNGSSLSVLYGGWKADQIRGRSARKVIFDECQMLPKAHIEIISEVTQAYPDDPELHYVGTAEDSRNHLWQRYLDSKQYEWLVTCKCGHQNPPLGRQHVDPAKPYLFCLKCGQKMNPRNGVWVAKNPDSQIAGFRICRLMTPTCRWHTDAGSGILDKLHDYSESKFFSEVLGLPYDIGRLPITEEELRACCDDSSFIDPTAAEQWVAGRTTLASIDWAWSDYSGAQSHTIMAIGIREDNCIRIIYAKRFVDPQHTDPEVVLTEIAQLVRQFNVKVVGTDFGVGHKENIRLRNRLPGCSVTEIQYVNSLTDSSYDPKARCYKLDKTQRLDMILDYLKRRKFFFPHWQESKTFLNDILNIYTIHDQDFRTHSYHHAGTGPDDFLHLLTYLQRIMSSYYG